MTRPRPLVPRGDPADTVRVVGEFGVIARVLAQAGTARSAEVGPGRRRGGRARPRTARVVATTDVLVEGRHFRRDWSSAEDIGHKAAAANLADVAAMGGVATALLVGLACPPTTQTAWLEGVAAGLAAECAPLGAAVVGGDLVAAATDSASVVISVTALGDLYGRPAGAALGGACRGRRGAGRAGWAGRRAGSPCCGGASAARSPRSRRTAGPTPPYAAGPAAADAGARRCATSATGCSPTPGTSPPTAASSSTWTGRR